MTKVVLLNGPPNSGKDVAAKYLSYLDPANVVHREFKAKLYELVMCIYDIDEEFFWKVYNNRELKETPMVEFSGLSVRQAMIKVSEEVIKPAYGKNYFGESAAKNLVDGKINVFSDSGFIEELIPIRNKVGAENMLLIRLLREGCTFKGDSRGYLDPKVAGIKSVEINNCLSLREYLELIEDTVLEWVK